MQCIPGITTEIVDEIIAQRTMDPTSAQTSRRYETWLLTEGIVTLDKMKALMPYITCGGDVYRLQVFGYADDGSVMTRLEVIIDASTQPVRVLFWRDISHLGRAYTPAILGVGSSQ